MSDKPLPRRDIYQEVTDKIITALESGTPPWRRPWDANMARPSGPFNGATGHQYRGINTLMLGMNPLSYETGDPRWMTFKQAQEKGWHVIKGSKASTVVFFKKLEIDDPDGDSDDDKKTVPVIRSYPVFHASQLDGIPSYVAPAIGDVPWRKPESAQVILSASGVPIKEGGERAFYSPSTDHIQLPPTGTFKGAQEWAQTALHELGHATGHPSRLNRDLRNRFGSNAYAMEELRAELASAFMAWELGISADIPQHASYIDSWLDVLKQDRRAIFSASADAQKISDWCLARHPDYQAVHSADTSNDVVTPVTVTAPEDFQADAVTVTSETAQKSTLDINAVVAKFGTMPQHIAKLITPKTEADVTPTFTPTPATEEASTWAPRI